jgi:Ran GTPase-activating protein (RanGAP) involved in mRNA processing and transport
MRPILNGDQNAALFAHQQISVHLPGILDVLGRSKMVTEMDLTDNSLTAEVIQPLVAFVLDSELSRLTLDDNPQIGPRGMQQLLEGIHDSTSLEIVSLANTGCNFSVGRGVALLIADCPALLKLDVSRCRLRGSAIEISQSLPNSPTLKYLNLSNNELFYGGRKLALQLGANVAKCRTLSTLDLSQNAISSEMAASLLRGMADAGGLIKLNLSRNEIGDAAGRAIATFISKASGLKSLDISQNPILNVIASKIEGQQKMDAAVQKPGDKKAKTKAYTPGCYLVVAAVAKSPSLKQLKILGLTVNPTEWEQKLEGMPSSVQILSRAPDAEMFNFRPRAAPLIIKPGGSGTPNTARRAK